MKFSKAKWLACAEAQRDAGIITQRELDDACRIWVNAADGRSREELEAAGDEMNADWFEEVSA